MPGGSLCEGGIDSERDTRLGLVHVALDWDWSLKISGRVQM